MYHYRPSKYYIFKNFFYFLSHVINARNVHLYKYKNANTYNKVTEQVFFSIFNPVLQSINGTNFPTCFTELTNSRIVVKQNEPCNIKSTVNKVGGGFVIFTFVLFTIQNTIPFRPPKSYISLKLLIIEINILLLFLHTLG